MQECLLAQGCDTTLPGSGDSARVGGRAAAARQSLEEGQRLTAALLAQQPDNQTLKQDAAWFAAKLKELDEPKKPAK